jgi:type II secretion system protein H
MHTRQANLGFTLIELLLVMAIIAIAAMLAAPSLSGFTRGRVLPNTATQLMTTARWCQIRAIADGRACRLNFDLAGRKWFVTEDDGTTGLVFQPIDDDMARDYVLPDGVDMTPSYPAADDGLYVTFDPSGRTDVGSIRLSSGSNWVDVVCQTRLSAFRMVEAKDQK